MESRGIIAAPLAEFRVDWDQGQCSFLKRAFVLQERIGVGAGV